MYIKGNSVLNAVKRRVFEEFEKEINDKTIVLYDEQAPQNAMKPSINVRQRRIDQSSINHNMLTNGLSRLYFFDVRYNHPAKVDDKSALLNFNEVADDIVNRLSLALSTIELPSYHRDNFNNITEYKTIIKANSLTSDKDLGTVVILNSYLIEIEEDYEREVIIDSFEANVTEIGG